VRSASWFADCPSATNCSIFCYASKEESSRASPFNMRLYLATVSSRLREHSYLAGGADHVARDDLGPLGQGAPEVCEGPRPLGEAPGGAAPGSPGCPHRPAPLSPRVTVCLLGAGEAGRRAWGASQRARRLAGQHNRHEGVAHRPGHPARSGRTWERRRAGTRRRRAGGARGQGRAGASASVGARFAKPGARGSSWGLACAAPQGRARDRGSAAPWPSVRGLGPAAPGDARGVAQCGWPCPRASRERAGAPPRPGGAPLERRAPRVPPGPPGWPGPSGRRVRRASARPGAGRPPQASHPPGPHPQWPRLGTLSARARPRARRADARTSSHDAAPGAAARRAPARPLLAPVPAPRASAAPVARLDGPRGRRETAGLELPPPLAGAIHPGGSPPAALLTWGLAGWADHAGARLHAALRRAPGRQQGTDEVSSYRTW